jgi:hypothetical protein
MNIKLKAAGITAALIVSAIAFLKVLSLATANFTTEQISTAVSLVCMSVLVYFMYKLVLTQLEISKNDK